VRFWPQCGAPVIAGARFCTDCGEYLAAVGAVPSPAAEATMGAGGALAPPAPIVTARRATVAAGIGENQHVIAPFAFVFFAILAVGVAVTILIMRQLPARERVLASTPAESAMSSSAQGGASAGGASTNDGTASASDSTGAASEKRGLPPGHPQVELPKQARDFIAQIAQKAESKPSDIAAWDQLGDVCERAAVFDSSYFAKAQDAYAHVLKLDPDNLDALRGVGNIDYDQRKYDQAIAAYEHYLSKKPDDPDVRTDLGTMYLSTGNADQAVVQYGKVLETHPDLFEANFNIGVAYAQMNNVPQARTAFERALKLAPNDNTRARVNQMLASLNGGGVPSAAGATKQQAAANSPASNPDTFQGAIELMLRDLPIAGPKVASVQWPSQNDARVLMDNFPMDQMPPFALAKFTGDLKSGIARIKAAHHITKEVKVDICDAASGRVMQSVNE
jgi:tetratricopeptide (TPR) repeat protein